MVLVAIVAGCTSSTASSAPTTASGNPVPASSSPAASAQNVPSPSSASSPSAAPVSEADIARAVQFRTRFGLKADEAFVRAVAEDPAHVIAYDIPLLPDEQAALDARPKTFEEISTVLQDYGAGHPGEYGGVFIEPPGSNQFVILFTGHLDEHSAALAKVVSPSAPIQLRSTPTAEKDLDALMERVSNDAAALRAAGIVVIESSRDDVGRVVDVGISTERPDAAGLLVSRYGPTVKVRVIDPTGAYLKAPGAVVGRVLDPSGKGVQAMVAATPLFADIPIDSMGYETTPAGTYRIADLLPGRWRISAQSDAFAPGSVDVDVPSGGVATADIVLKPK